MLLGNAKKKPENPTSIAIVGDPSIVFAGTWTDDEEGSKLSSSVGDTITFTFTGTTLAGAFLFRTQGATFNVTIDGGNQKTFYTFGRGTTGVGAEAGYWVDSDISMKDIVLYDGLENISHTVVITITSERDSRWVENGENPQLRFIGFLYGDFDFNPLSGSVKDFYGNRISTGSIFTIKGEVKEEPGVNDVGEYSSSGLPQGFYKGQFLFNGDDYKTHFEDFKVLGEDVQNDITLEYSTGHVLWQKIIFPNEGTPAFIPQNGDLVIEFVAPSDATGFAVTIGTDTPAVTAQYQGYGVWYLTVGVSGIADGVYNLTVSYSGFAGDTKRKCVAIGNAPSDYYFVVVDSPEQRWETPESYKVDEAVVAINALSPAPKFVVITGDCVANPRSQSEANTKFNSLADFIQTLNVPVFALPGNHDLGGAGTIRALDLWMQYVGKRYHALTYGAERFIFHGNGNYQTVKIEDFGAEQHQWYQNEITAYYGTKNLYSFRHARNVTTGYQYWPDFEKGKVNTVMYGHYNVDEDFTNGGTRYIQTKDMKDGWYRVIHMVNGAISSAVAYQST